MNADEPNPQEGEQRLQDLFGAHTRSEAPLAVSGAGCRLIGVDLRQRLSPKQVAFLLGALDRFRILCIAGQDLDTFSLAHFERFANHWGAPVPHPINFLRGGKPAQSDGASDGAFELIPFERRRAAGVNAAFPGKLRCLEHESPAVNVVANCSGGAKGKKAGEISMAGTWHTDIEFEPLPTYVSMFLAHKMPVRRDVPGGTWVPDAGHLDPHDTEYLADSDAELMRRRLQLPLNGETAFADTAAALAALPPERQARLERVRVRRRLNEGDEGWLAPLVRTNPRSGIKSLHSPIWASRPRRAKRPAIEVDGMSGEESRAFLDELEAHVLQSRFRYDHLHVPGDVTIWDNYTTVHTVPPVKTNVDCLDDVRLLYRLSCKGEPSLTLPRHDAPEWLEANIAGGGYSTPAEIIDLP